MHKHLFTPVSCSWLQRHRAYPLGDLFYECRARAYLIGELIHQCIAGPCLLDAFCAKLVQNKKTAPEDHKFNKKICEG